jgi:hypothetical protein
MRSSSRCPLVNVLGRNWFKCRRYLLQMCGRGYLSVEEAAYFSQSASTAFGCRGAYAIRALPDLCRGITSERLGGLAHFSFQIILVIYLEPRFERPGLSLTLCLSAGTEPSATCCVGQLVICACRPNWCRWQASARRVPVAGRGAYAMRVIAKPRPGRPGRGFCARYAEESLSLYHVPHPSPDSRLILS